MTGDFSFENETRVHWRQAGIWGRYRVSPLNIGSYSVSLDHSGDLNLSELPTILPVNLWRLRNFCHGRWYQDNTSPTEFRLDLER